MSTAACTRANIRIDRGFGGATLALAASTALTAAYLHHFPWLMSMAAGRVVAQAWIVVPVSLVLSAPVIWAMGSQRAGLAALSLHCLTWITFWSLLAVSHPPDPLDSVGLTFVVIVAAIDVSLLLLYAKRCSDHGRFLRRRFPRDVALVGVLVVGLALGFTWWAVTLPAAVRQAANEAAAGAAYCIDVDGRPAEDWLDLTGFRMRATTEGVLKSFHALLSVQGPEGRRLLNWSYHSGRFEPVTSTRLKVSPSCHP